MLATRTKARTGRLTTLRMAQGAPKNIPRRNLQFLINGLVFPRLLLRIVCVKSENFVKSLLICVEMANPETQEYDFCESSVINTKITSLFFQFYASQSER